MITKRLSVLLVSILISACAQTKYHWGGYENALYQYYKSPAELGSLAKELRGAITQGEQDEKVPPGLYAELGYVLLVQGKKQEAVTYFQKEKKLWPESAKLMDTMVKMAKTSGGVKSAGSKGENR